MHNIEAVLLRTWLVVMDRPRRRGRETGDVPGWVMITILSAVLVVGLIAVAGPALNDLFSKATNSVSTKSP